MNSIFNLSSSNLRFMSDEELLNWLHSEGLANMPPIIRDLVDRLEDAQAYVEENEEWEKELEESESKLRKELEDFDAACDQYLDKVSADLDNFADRIDSALEELDGIEPEDLIALREKLQSVCRDLVNYPLDDHFPETPSI